MRHLTLKLTVLGLALTVAAGCRDGEGITVRHLAFEGVRQVNPSDLRAAMVTTAAGWLPWSGKTFFSRQDFDDDLRRLEAFYAARGYPDARVRAFRTHYLDRKTRMDLTVVIDEGAPLTVDAVEWRGFDALPEAHQADLRRRAGLTPGVPRDLAQVEIARNLARTELREHGFPAAEVDTIERPVAGRHAVVVTLTARPGPFARFGAVDLTGNGRVSPRVVRRQLGFTPGEPYRQSALTTTERRLYGLELFQFVTIEPGEVTADGTVPTRITLVEAKHRQLRFGVGWGTEDHARAEAEWSSRNFFGGARNATVHVKGSSLERGVRVSLTDPSLPGGASVGVSGQSWSSSTPAYALRTTGGRVGLLASFGAPVAPGVLRTRNTVSLSFARDFERYTVSADALNDASLRPTLIALGLNPYSGEGRSTVVAVALDAQRTTVPDLLDARRGVLLALHTETAVRALGGDVAYQEATAEARAYVPVGRRLVVAGKGRAGWIGTHQDPDTSVPFFKRYFLGGATGLRGWSRFDVAPLSPDGLPIGGYTFLETSGEARLDLTDRGAFGVVGFVDAGNVWGQTWKLPDLGDLRVDAGAGLRVGTPVGPLRFDVAYQLTPVAGLLRRGGLGEAGRWRFHLSFGQAF